MENKLIKEENKSSLNLEDRKALVMSGVLEILNFNDEKITLNTNLGSLAIKGKNLRVKKLDLENSEVIIHGYVDSLVYSGTKAKRKKRFIIPRFRR